MNNWYGPGLVPGCCLDMYKLRAEKYFPSSRTYNNQVIINMLRKYRKAPCELGIGAAILGSAAIGGVASAFQSISARKAQKRQFQYQQQLNEQQNLHQLGMADVYGNWQKRLMNEQNAFNKQMLENQREYDSPSAVLDRIREAGLSPAAMASGNGLQSIAKAGQSLTSASPTVPTASVSGSGGVGMTPVIDPSVAFSNVSNGILAQAQARRIDHETPTSEQFNSRWSAQTQNFISQSGNQDAQASFTSYQESFERGVQSDRVETIKQELANLETKGIAMLSEAVENNASASLKMSMCQTQIYERALLTWKMKQIKKGIEVSDAQIDWFKAQASHYFESAAYQKMEREYMQKQSEGAKGMTNYEDIQRRVKRNITATTVSKYVESTVGALGDFLGKGIGGLLKGLAGRQAAGRTTKSTSKRVVDSNGEIIGGSYSEEHWR